MVIINTKPNVVINQDELQHSSGSVYNKSKFQTKIHIHSFGNSGKSIFFYFYTFLINFLLV